MDATRSTFCNPISECPPLEQATACGPGSIGLCRCKHPCQSRRNAAAGFGQADRFLRRRTTIADNRPVYSLLAGSQMEKPSASPDHLLVACHWPEDLQRP